MNNICQINYAAKKNLLLSVDKDGNLKAVSFMSYIGRCIRRLFSSNDSFADCNKEKVAKAIEDTWKRNSSSIPCDELKLGELKRSLQFFQNKWCGVNTIKSINDKLKNSRLTEQERSILNKKLEDIKKTASPLNEQMDAIMRLLGVSIKESTTKEKIESTKYKVDNFVSDLNKKIKDKYLKWESGTYTNSIPQDNMHLILNVRKYDNEMVIQGYEANLDYHKMNPSGLKIADWGVQSGGRDYKEIELKVCLHNDVFKLEQSQIEKGDYQGYCGDYKGYYGDYKGFCDQLIQNLNNEKCKN